VYTFLISPMCAKCPHLTILIIFCEAYRLWSYLCLLQPPATFSLLKLSLCLIKHHYPMGTGDFFLGGKAAGAWSCSPPCNAKVKNYVEYTSTPPTSSWCGA
jgi:hypothetical protein